MAMRGFGQTFADVMELRLVFGDSIMEPETCGCIPEVFGVALALCFVELANSGDIDKVWQLVAVCRG